MTPRPHACQASAERERGERRHKDDGGHPDPPDHGHAPEDLCRDKCDLRRELVARAHRQARRGSSQGVRHRAQVRQEQERSEHLSTRPQGLAAAQPRLQSTRARISRTPTVLDGQPSRTATASWVIPCR